MSNYKLRIVIENKSTVDVSFTLFILVEVASTELARTVVPNRRACLFDDEMEMELYSSYTRSNW